MSNYEALIQIFYCEILGHGLACRC